MEELTREMTKIFALSILQVFKVLLNPLFLTIIAVLIFVIIQKNREYKAGAYYRITKIPYISILMRRDLGKYGEYLTYKQLKHFENEGASFLFNVYIPKDNGETTEIDVLMLTAKGIFVFESKNYSGWIFGNEERMNWYQTLPTGRGRSRKEHFYNPIMQNRTHIKCLRALTGDNVPLYSVILFSERCELKDISLKSQDVKVVKRGSASAVVSEVFKKVHDTVISADDIKALYDTLYPYTQLSDDKKEKHIADIKCKTGVSLRQEKSRETTADNEVHTSDTVDATGDICPKCGGKLVLRTAKRGERAGKHFFGCSNFPKCRYIKNIK